MVLCLVLNVFPDFLDIGLTDREAGVSSLPLKFPVACAIVRLHPLRTALLDFFNNLLEGKILRERKQRVYVIFDTADYESGTFQLSEYTSLVCEKTVTNIFRNPRLAVFRAVDKMDEVRDQGLCQCCAAPVCFALSGLVFVVLPSPRAALHG